MGGIELDVSGANPCGAVGGLATNVGGFAGSGKAGSGAASCGDRTSPQVKTPATPHPLGRFSPQGGGWVDSNDLTRVDWLVDVGVAFTGFSFALTDAHDRPNSFFEMSVDGASWDIADREPNGTLHWITVLFDSAVNSANVTFLTKHNDGFGVSDVNVQPVPAPAALWLMLTGLALAAAAGSRPHVTRRGAL